MNISPIQPSSIQPIGPIEIGGATPASGSSEFGNILQGAIDQVEGASNTAKQSVQQFLSGDGEDLHTTVLAKPAFVNPSGDDYRLAVNPNKIGVDWAPSEYIYGPTGY